MNRVSMLRTEAGMSQRDLAAKLGVQPSVVSKYESSSVQLQEDTLRQLAAIFSGVSTDFILGLSDERTRGTSYSMPKIAWDAVALVEGANTLSEENRTVLLDAIKEPELLDMLNQILHLPKKWRLQTLEMVKLFLLLSNKSQVQVMEYAELLKLADEVRAKKQSEDGQPG